jgi:HD-GYP domain-containing protein (c-di-GMP phosphodiesterase class II)
MRFVPVSSLVEGMICGKKLYDINHQLLLNSGSIIQKGYIERITSLGYQGIYIEDNLSSDIEVKDIISDELRMSAIKAVKDICIYAGSQKKDYKSLDLKVQKTKLLISNIVEQILENKDTMVNLIDLKFYDDYTFFHSVNVAVLSILVGAEYGLEKSELFNVGLASILHDIGKMFVSKDVLNKPGKLTIDEFEAVKQHPSFGFNYLKESYEIPASVYVAVLQHHERYDGTGYPMQKSKDQISIIGRIICVADVYDALTSSRPYRKALLPSEAMEYIMANGGTMFDLELTKIFARKVAPFPIGTYVTLSNGFTGIVINNYEDACMRPKVKVIMDQNQEMIEPINFDLRSDRLLRSVTITGVNHIS